jgi:outer membrane assembly lipoprotein YfiO
MRAFARFILFSFLLSGLLGCGPKGAKLQKSVVPPDKTLFETGQEYLKKSQYIKARLAFQTLINTYTDSELSADSYLAIGDSYYNEGGTENLLQAEDQYKNFIIFFPTNPKAVDAQMKIVALNMKMMRSPDRDPSYSVKAEAAAKRLLEQFSDSDYVPIVTGYLKEIQENLAQGNFGVGRFYADKGNLLGAQSRYQEIVDKYQDFSLLDETYFRLADVLEKSKKADEAAVYYTRLAQAFPNSRYFEDAKSRLSALGKPVPAVDAQLAGLHAPKSKEGDGFSPLKPFISFAEALGFKGPPDRYEEAKKAVEDKKAEALLAAQAPKPTDVVKTGDGILIETTIRKNASGQTETSTVLGSGSGNGTQTTTNNAGKKQSNKKSKKKPEKKQ